MMFASVVLPTPGGPQKINEPVSSRSIWTRSGLPGPRMCSCPTNSSSVRGRMRSASGRVLSPASSGCEMFWKRLTTRFSAAPPHTTSPTPRSRRSATRPAPTAEWRQPHPPAPIASFGKPAPSLPTINATGPRRSSFRDYGSLVRRSGQNPYSSRLDFLQRLRAVQPSLPAGEISIPPMPAPPSSSTD